MFPAPCPGTWVPVIWLHGASPTYSSSEVLDGLARSGPQIHRHFSHEVGAFYQCAPPPFILSPRLPLTVINAKMMWWRALCFPHYLPIYAGNPLATDGFPAQRVKCLDDFLLSAGISFWTTAEWMAMWYAMTSLYAIHTKPAQYFSLFHEIFNKIYKHINTLNIHLSGSLARPMDQFHKSQNAPVPYPTILHSEQKCVHFCSEWSIVGYGTGRFWDLWIRSIFQAVVGIAIL